MLEAALMLTTALSPAVPGPAITRVSSAGFRLKKTPANLGCLACNTFTLVGRLHASPEECIVCHQLIQLAPSEAPPVHNYSMLLVLVHAILINQPMRCGLGTLGQWGKANACGVAGSVVEGGHDPVADS
jgi:hypothetical protein